MAPCGLAVLVIYLDTHESLALERFVKSDRSHVVLCAKELVFLIVFLRPLGLRLKRSSVK